MKALVGKMRFKSNMKLSSNHVKLGPFSKALLNLKQGNVRGRQFAYAGYEAFKGIPYAKPPVQDRRWRAPEPVDPWDEEIDGENIAPNCYQVTF